MTAQGVTQIVVYALVLVALGYPLGLFMAWVYAARRTRFESGFYRLIGTDGKEQDWKAYAKAVLVFSVVSTLLLYAIQRLQHSLFLNPDHLPAVAPHIALNTTA